MELNPFRRKKIKVEGVDPDQVRKDFIKEARSISPSIQECYKRFLKYHKRGTIFDSNYIYTLFQGRLLKIRR